MENQKIENLLNMSIETDNAWREKSRDLSVGFDPQDRTWEVILKYSGDVEALEQEFDLTFVTLLNQYAITKGTQAQIEKLAGNPRVEFIEKPKSLLYSDTEGNQTSCISPLTPPAGNLTGKGVLIGIIDSGIDIFHPDFIWDDGSSRIVGVWDQTGTGNPPKGYKGGRYYNAQELNEAVRQGRSAGKAIVEETDLSGHGTHVAGIAAGNGRASGGKIKGVAVEAELLIVKLGNPPSSDFPRTTQLMAGVDFCVRYAFEKNQPLVLNLSFGNNFGSHSGDSLLETYLESLMGLGKITIVTGTGNEGNGGRHASGTVTSQKEEKISFVAGPYEQSFSVQLWKNYADIFDIILEHPSGEKIGPLSRALGLTQFRIRQTEILIYFGEPSPYRISQEIYFSFLPVENAVDSGIWSISLIPKKIVVGSYAMWLPDSGLTSSATKFLRPSISTTLTIPSTAVRLISVGAYDAYTDSMAPFSGRGNTIQNLVKPDLVAPGVNIESCAPGGGYTIKSGTSMAAPFVAGSAALLMEDGIINGKDPFLFGEKIKAYLRSGARPLPGFSEYPNPQTGYGALCVRNSITD
jgi:subtilisin family serine protease